jgi:dTDP-4-dehydrorhamnose 3,5-epimerase
LSCASSFAQAGIDLPIAQINHTLTRQQGTVRGLHFQNPPHADGKLVSCVQGQIFDVAVDLRAGSPTFLQWHAHILSAENQCSLWIPPGFAHGFQALTSDCELIYLHSNAHAPASEGALHAQDPTLSIDWPLNITEMSVRDQSHLYIQSTFKGVTL